MAELVQELLVVGDEAERTAVLRAVEALGLAIEERPASAVGDLGRARVAVACGTDLARALAQVRRAESRVRVVAALRRGEDPSVLAGSGVDDYVSLEAPADEIAARLGFALARATDPAAGDVRLAELGEVIDDLLGVTTGDGGRNLYLNAAYDRITGRSRAEVMEQPIRFLEIVHPDDHEILREAYRRKDAPHEYELRILRPDGEIRWLRARAFPSRNPDGTTARIITITRDVTERKRAEAGDAAQRALIEGVATALTALVTRREPRAIDDALAVLGDATGIDRVYVARHDHDDAGTIRVAVTHEWTREGVPRLPPSIDVSGSDIVRPAARPFIDLIERGRSVEAVVSELPADVRARLDPSGARSMLVVPVMTDRGCWGQVGFVDCHTDRRWDASARATLEAAAAAIGSAIMRERAMEALAQQVHRIRSLYEAAAHPLGPRDRLQRLLEVGAHLLGVDVSGVLRVRAEDTDTCELVYVHAPAGPMRPGDRVPLTRDLFDAAVAENRPMSFPDAVGTRYESDPTHRDHGFRSFLGAPVWVRGHAWGGLVFLATKPRDEPFYDVDADLARLLASGVAHMLEQIEREEEQRVLDARLRETQKLESLGLLAGGLAHDFNNLLMTIMGNATLAARADDAAGARESLDQISAAARRAADLTRQMLAYAGGGPIRIEPTSLPALIREISELLAVVLPTDARLEQHIAPDLPPVLGDDAQLQQIVMNLVTNAGESLGGRPGTIAVRAWRSGVGPPKGRFVADDAPAGDYVALEVRDTGIGMDAGTLDRIFEPFFTTKGTGRGLGLATVLGVVRTHRGALEVESAPENGTTFRVYLPAAEGVPRSVEPTLPSDDAQLDARVLVVDDSDQVRTTVRRILEQRGARVSTARDGVEAIAEVERALSHGSGAQLDVVVLDLTMPRMDGAQAHARIREIAPKLPVLVMSGYADASDIRGLLGRPYTAFLQKPFDAPTLAATLRTLLASRD